MNIKKPSMATPAPTKAPSTANPNVAGKTGVIIHKSGCGGNHLGACNC